MSLQEKLVSSFMVFENQGNVDLDSNIHGIRCEAISDFETQGFPTKKR